VAARLRQHLKAAGHVGGSRVWCVSSAPGCRPMAVGTKCGKFMALLDADHKPATRA